MEGEDVEQGVGGGMDPIAQGEAGDTAALPGGGGQPDVGGFGGQLDVGDKQVHGVKDCGHQGWEGRG